MDELLRTNASVKVDIEGRDAKQAPMIRLRIRELDAAGSLRLVSTFHLDRDGARSLASSLLVELAELDEAGG